MRRLLAVGFFVGFSAQAQIFTESFGSGADSFAIDFVGVENPGNAPDSNGLGGVNYSYRMGKFEVSAGFIAKANAEGGLGLPVWAYSGWSASPSQPVYSTTFYNAARFVNWLNTSKGYAPAYKFATQPGETGYDAYAGFSSWASSDSGFNPQNPNRNSGARFFLPTISEWWKSAYYDSSTASFFDFATGSNTAPTAVTSGTDPNTSVYGLSSRDGRMADVGLAGGLSPYGTMAQSGNAWEWTEGIVQEILPGSIAVDHGVALGGSYSMSELKISANYTWSSPRSYDGLGFRVLDSVPEPSSASLLVVGGLVALARRKRAQNTPRNALK